MNIFNTIMIPIISDMRLWMTAGAAGVVALGLYINSTLPPLASTREFDRKAVHEFALNGGLGDPENPEAPLLNIYSIVTGSTSGLGREIASELYALGSTVILASRSAKKTMDIAQSIMDEHPKSKGI